MSDLINGQLISYIAPGAPATRRWAEGGEPFLRPEMGFTPRWYRQHAEIDFGERYHVDPAYRVECQEKMRAVLLARFPGWGIGGTGRALDALTGVYGACCVGGMYGLPLVYSEDNWPNCAHEYLSEEEVDLLEPPDLEKNPFFAGLMAQVDWIAGKYGRAEGYVNWQGVLNNAHRLRGEALFTDMMMAPARARHLFECVCASMIDGARRLQARQAALGVGAAFFTVSNCLVNLVSPEQYRALLLPFDRRIAEAFGVIGIHNCAWKADPYLEAYASIPQVRYIDMGIDSDLARARGLFPGARRAVMYTPMDVANKKLKEIRTDLEYIARHYAPCDVVFADIEAGTPDDKVAALCELCAEQNARDA